jgi:glycine/D-amino acid oxidase-like deaminating enzyme
VAQVTRTVSHSPHAVVVGAGIDGLAAARALGHHLERVTLVERDDLPDRTVPGTTVPHLRYLRALRLVLDSPTVVVRSGLEVVGIACAAGRVLGVEVCPRRGGRARAVATIAAELVVDATGRPPTSAAALPDGLIVAGLAAASHADDVGPGGVRAEAAGAALSRCLARHLAARADLAGFSAVAQRAMALSDAGTPSMC